MRSCGGIARARPSPIAGTNSNGHLGSSSKHWSPVVSNDKNDNKTIKFQFSALLGSNKHAPVR